jgi:hypothetical protein
MGKSSVQVCAYCRKEKHSTKDHVPPKTFLATPYPRDLVTVPSCFDCNRGFQRDDEYTRTVVALDLRAHDNPSAVAKLPEIFRSLQRPQAAGFAESIRRNLMASSILDANGQPLGSVFTVDIPRIEATGKHIARGLHYHFGGSPLPLDYKLFVQSKPGYDSIDHVVPSFISFYEKCSARREGQVGDGFSYVAGSAGTAFVWLLLLYGYFWWIVIAVPPDFPQATAVNEG